MTIVRWRPFNDIISLTDAVDRFFEETWLRPSEWLTWRAAEAMPVDMYATDNEVVIKAALPGVRPEDIEVSALGDTVTIKGEVKEDQELREGECICQETRYGTFFRQITVPVPVQADKAEARFENGVLYLTLPKAEEARPKQIKVKVQPLLEGKAKKEAKK